LIAGICKGEGYKLPDKTNNGNYFVCKAGIPEKMKCEPGLVFIGTSSGTGDCRQGDNPDDSTEVVYEYEEY